MKHQVHIGRQDGNTIAVCSCGAGSEWQGGDESSRLAAKAWKTKHEEEN